MPKQFRAEFGPRTNAWSKGLNNFTDPSMLGPEFGTSVVNCDMRTGIIRGIYGPGTRQDCNLFSPSGGDVDLTYTWVGWVGNGLAVGSPDQQWLCNDTINNLTNFPTSYMTDIRAGDPRAPRIWYLAPGPEAFFTFPLGLPAPAAAPVMTDGSSGGARGYAYTYVSYDPAVSSDVLESNPSLVNVASVTKCGGAVLSFVVLADDRVTGMNVYCTRAGDPLGTLYQKGGTVTTFTDTAADPDLTKPLLFLAGGSPTQTPYIDDHSPAPFLNVISLKLHSATADGSGSPGAGALFGATHSADGGGSIVYWSTVGQVQYWPTRQFVALGDRVEAITSRQGRTHVFCQDSIYTFVGTDGWDMTWTRAANSLGPRSGFGHSLATTPHGEMYVAREGLVLWDGQTPRIVSRGILDPAWLGGLSVTGAYYYDGCYWLFHTAGTLIVDLLDFPDLRMTTSNVIATGAFVTPASLPDPIYGEQPGAWVHLAGETFLIHPWHYSEPSVGAAHLDWSWKTGKITSGSLNQPFQTVRWWMQGTGVTATFFFDDGVTPLPKADGVTTCALTGDSWLPMATGRGLQVNMAGAGTSAVMRSFQVDGVAYDVY